MKNQKITSFDAENVGIFGDALSAPIRKEPLSVGVIGLGYFEYWRMYPELQAIVEKDLENAVSRLNAALADCRVIYPGMIDTLDRAENAGCVLADANVEIVIILAGTYLPDFITMHAINRIAKRPQVILFNTQTGEDVNPCDNYAATMRNSALIAMTQLSGSFRKMNLEYETVVGEISDPDAYREIAELVSAYSAVKRLKMSTYGIVGHVFRGMYDLEFDRARVKGFLGPEVMTIQADHLVELWKRVSEKETEDIAEKLWNRFAVRHVEKEDVTRSVRLGLAMRALSRKYHLDGLCFLGQHYLEKMTGAPARMGASMLNEMDGFPVCCEGDVGGLVMCDLMKQFTGNTAFQAEWGQFDRTRNAVFLLGHGIGVPAMAKTEQDICLTSSPEEWGFQGKGLNYELILKPGPVTMGHFLNTGDTYQMLISRGESINFPTLPCNELHAMIQVRSPVCDYLKNIINSGTAHHIIVVPGDAWKTLQKTAELMRIKCINVE